MRVKVAKALPVLAGAILLLVGCLDSKTVLTVNKDGSATLVQTLYMKPPQAGMNVKEKTLDEVKADCGKLAPMLGEGVTLKSATALEPRDQWKGYKIVYAVPDVTKLKVGFMPAISPMMKTESKDLLTFEFQGGAEPKLTVVRPPINAGGKQGDDEEAEPNPEMVKAFDGMRLAFEVCVNGTITSTNATTVNADKTGVVLLVEDVGGLIKDKEAYAAMKALSKLKDPDAIRTQLKSALIQKYIKFEPEDKVTIQFK